METDQDNISVRVASFAYYLDTAKDSFVRGVSAQEGQLILNPEKTISHASKPPLNANVSHSKRHSKDALASLRVDSFSYNRDRTGENFVLGVPDPTEDHTKSFTFSQGNPKKDGEISVFGADKYFSMKLEYPTSQKNERPADLIGIESKIKPRTPSLCSEASSWNSQSALIPSMQRNGSQTKPKKPVRRRLFAGLGCQGPCFDKKDVRANDIVFIPPISLNHAAENDGAVKKKLSLSDIEESRTSIEVFGSSEAIKPKGSSDVAANMERKLSMLTWDAIPVKKGQAFQTSTTAAHSTICDIDMASDASSDLFEIENISGTLYPMLSSATETDNVSTCMSPAYAPSEESIQWSVVTASAADYSSVLSEFNDETAGDLMNGGNNRKFKLRNVGEKEVQKSKASGGLLGCKNLKAVDVAENVCLDKASRVKDHKDILQLPKSYAKIH